MDYYIALAKDIAFKILREAVSKCLFADKRKELQLKDKPTVTSKSL